MRNTRILFYTMSIFLYSFLQFGCNPVSHFEIYNRGSIDTLNGMLKGKLFRVTTTDNTYEGKGLKVTYDSTCIEIPSLKGGQYSLITFPTRDVKKIQKRIYTAPAIKGLVLGTLAGATLGAIAYLVFVGPDPGVTNSGPHPEYARKKSALIYGGTALGALVGFLIGNNGQWEDINITQSNPR